MRFLYKWNPEYQASAEKFTTPYAYISDYLQINFSLIENNLVLVAASNSLLVYDVLLR